MSSSRSPSVVLNSRSYGNQAIDKGIGFFHLLMGESRSLWDPDAAMVLTGCRISQRQVGDTDIVIKNYAATQIGSGTLSMNIVLEIGAPVDQTKLDGRYVCSVFWNKEENAFIPRPELLYWNLYAEASFTLGSKIPFQNNLRHVLQQVDLKALQGSGPFFKVTLVACVFGFEGMWVREVLKEFALSDDSYRIESIIDTEEVTSGWAQSCKHIDESLITTAHEWTNEHVKAKTNTGLLIARHPAGIPDPSFWQGFYENAERTSQVAMVDCMFAADAVKVFGALLGRKAPQPALWQYRQNPESAYMLPDGKPSLANGTDFHCFWSIRSPLQI